MPSNTLIQLDGGHSTVVQRNTSELTRIIEDGRLHEEFVFIQSESHGDNGLVLDPWKVVALMRVGRAENPDPTP